MDQLGVARRQLDAVVASFPGPRRDLAAPRRHGVDLVRRHRMDRSPQEGGAQGQRQFRRRQQRSFAFLGVRVVPRLHGVDAAVADLQEDRSTLSVNRIDHLTQRQHSLSGVDECHPRRRTPLLVDARVALHDQPDTSARVGDELATDAVGPVARPPAQAANRPPGEQVVGAQARYRVARQQEHDAVAQEADAGGAGGAERDAVDRQLAQLVPGDPPHGARQRLEAVARRGRFKRRL